MVVTFTGKCDQLKELETTAQNCGVPALILNHVHVQVVLKPLKGADLKSAREELGIVEGVVGMTMTAAGVELHADLSKLTLENLRGAAAKFKCDVVVDQTFEFVRYRVVEGDFEEYRSTLESLKGVMTLSEEGDNILGFWINKALVKPEHVEKVKEIKVERL